MTYYGALLLSSQGDRTLDLYKLAKKTDRKDAVIDQREIG